MWRNNRPVIWPVQGFLVSREPISIFPLLAVRFMLSEHQITK
jgi:hypothetical protein